VPADAQPSSRPPTWLEREILAQGGALRDRAAAGAQAAEAAAAPLRDGVDYLLVAARGSSDNAARYAQYLLGAEVGLTVALAAPWLYAEKPGSSERPRAPRIGSGAVLGISQSGRSPDIVAVLAAARAQLRPALAITNDEDSPLARAADVVIPLGVGAERSVAATKTYTASLQAVAQLVAALDPGGRVADGIGELPNLVTAIAAEQLATRRRFEALESAERIVVVGRGFAYAAAHETALKLRELSGIPAEAFSPPDLLHGPVAALDRATALWVIAPAADPDGELAALVRALRERGGPAVIVAADRGVLELADVPVALPERLADWAAAFVAIVPAQAAALWLAERRGVEVDEPHGLHKVTLTR
jgi:glucosamine--fructose-6-phosphate aminotransferase (isomerizing)